MIYQNHLDKTCKCNIDIISANADVETYKFEETHTTIDNKIIIIIFNDSSDREVVSVVLF